MFKIPYQYAFASYVHIPFDLHLISDVPTLHKFISTSLKSKFCNYFESFYLNYFLRFTILITNRS